MSQLTSQGYEMKTIKLMLVLNTLMLLDAFYGQEGSWGLGDVVRLSGIPRATADRYLRCLESLAYVDVEWVEYRGALARRFKPTAVGRRFVDGV